MVNVPELFEEANDPDTDSNVLIKLAKSDEELVRAAVALNESASEEIIEVLKNDPSHYVRACVQKRLIQSASSHLKHPTAIISKESSLGNNVVVGPYTIIHKNVSIQDGTVIGSHCEIGHPAHNSSGVSALQIGKNSLIRSHSILYEGSVFGDNLITGHGVTVREQTYAGMNFQIGTLSDIQGNCEIGDFVRLHSNVHIGQQSKVGNYVWIFPYTVLTNDPHPPSNVLMGVTVEDYVAIATMSVILPGVTLGEGSLIGAHSSVTKDVAKNTVVAGVPAKFICNTNEIKLKDGTNAPAYPWRRHFHRGYLPKTVEAWIQEFSHNQSGSSVKNSNKHS